MNPFVQMILRFVGVTQMSLMSRRSQSTAQQYVKTRRRINWKRLVASAAVLGSGVYLGKILLPDLRSEVDPTHYYSDWKIRVYTSLPWNAVSRLAGYGSRLTIPESLRPTLYGWFARTYGCDMEEARINDFRAYPTFSAFFNRPLHSRARPISDGPMVSPADGTILHFGEIIDSRVEYVKGHDYHIDEFLGPGLKTKPGNKVYQLVVYLAPGDYHAFHSPIDWYCHQRIHHAGHLLSVRPSVLEWIPKLFCINERIVLSGSYKYGYFSLTAVAATNVGDINIDHDFPLMVSQMDTDVAATNETFSYKKGQRIGEFRLGSTVVLVFEAPSQLEFTVRAGDRVRYGQSLILKDL